jgi:hypothetical protein
MRRFNWRKFRRKGSKKLVSKDEKMLESNVETLKQEVKSTGSIEEVSKEVLPEE